MILENIFKIETSIGTTPTAYYVVSILGMLQKLYVKKKVNGINYYILVYYFLTRPKIIGKISNNIIQHYLQRLNNFRNIKNKKIKQLFTYFEQLLCGNRDISVKFEKTFDINVSPTISFCSALALPSCGSPDQTS